MLNKMIEEIFKTSSEQMEDPNQLIDQDDIDVSRRQLKKRRNLSPEDLDKAKNYTGWIPSGESRVREREDPEDIQFKNPPFKDTVPLPEDPFLAELKKEFVDYIFTECFGGDQNWAIEMVANAIENIGGTGMGDDTDDLYDEYDERGREYIIDLVKKLKDYYRTMRESKQLEENK